MIQRIVALLFFIISIVILTIFTTNLNKNISVKELEKKEVKKSEIIHPLAISEMRKRKYDGGDIKIEEELSSGSNYKRFIASYTSDGLKIYGLLTMPEENRPEKGFPAIIFNHGYIPPEEYETTQKYAAYVDGLAKEGYVVFKSDYRGHGNSQGRPEGAYFSPAYTVDVLNALDSIKKLKEVDSNRIGMWGHSLGGNITLRSMVISKDIKTGVIWGGVVGTYQEIFDEWWNKRIRPTFTPSQRERLANRPTRQSFIEKFGKPADTNEFWKSISPNFYLDDISGPIQLHHGTADETVPYVLSEKLHDRLTTAGKTSEIYLHDGADHNLSSSAFAIAMQRSVEFFNKYLK